MSKNPTVKSTIRKWGQKITWLHAGEGGVDLDSGKQKSAFAPKVIRKALVLQEVVTEKFTYDLSYIAANKNFVQGGFYSQGKRGIVVWKDDLLNFSHQDRVEIDKVVYNIEGSFDNPNGAYGFNLVDVKNA